jgi:DNA-binding NtrC family response regulator
VRGATEAEETTPSNIHGRIAPRRRTKLSSGDSLQIGSARLVFEDLGDDTKAAIAPEVADSSWVVRDPEMLRTFALAERAAASDISVLILGERGVGKEPMAEAVYRHSRRSKNTFLKINCVALPGSLREAELFGGLRYFRGGDVTG